MEPQVKAWAEVLNGLVLDGAFPTNVHRALLYGPPGTGKSTWARETFGACNVERITLHTQLPPEDLIGSMALVAQNGGTNTVWQDGPAVRAMRQGKVLVLDEIDQHSPEVRCALHALLDDRSIAGVTLPTGERVEPADGFAVVATTNAQPDTLPAALLDRFDFTLLADTPAPAILERLPVGFANILTRTYERQRSHRWTPAISVRSILAVQRLSQALPIERAAEIIFGENGTDIVACAAVVQG